MELLKQLQINEAMTTQQDTEPDEVFDTELDEVFCDTEPDEISSQILNILSLH